MVKRGYPSKLDARSLSQRLSAPHCRQLAWVRLLGRRGDHRPPWWMGRWAHEGRRRERHDHERLARAQVVDLGGRLGEESQQERQVYLCQGEGVGVGVGEGEG